MFIGFSPRVWLRFSDRRLPPVPSVPLVEITSRLFGRIFRSNSITSSMLTFLGVKEGVVSLACRVGNRRQLVLFFQVANI